MKSPNLKEWLALTVVMLIGLALRLFHLSHQGLFIDEAWVWAVAKLPWRDLLSLSLPEPILHYLLVKLCLFITPDSEAWLRLPSLLLSMSSLALAMLYAKSRWGFQAALFAGILFAFSSFDIYYAQEARMYTLLPFLWLASYIFFDSALRGNVWGLAGWAICTLLMAWTQAYGILVAAAYLTFILGCLAHRKLQGQPACLDWRYLALSLAGITLGMLAVLSVIIQHPPPGTSTWIPDVGSLLQLFLLCSLGLANARWHFTDTDNMVWAPLAAVPALVWGLAGLLAYALPAMYGLFSAWKMKGDRRLEAGLAVTLVVIPVAIAFIYSNLMSQPAWALKPFLGAAYLLYLWAGIGISRFPWRGLRIAVALAAVLLSCTSLLPYYTTWEKSPAAAAMRSLPALDEQDVVFAEHAYESLLVSYYLGETYPVYGVGLNKERNWQAIKMTPTGILHGNYKTVQCRKLAAITDIWIYGRKERILAALPHWPRCLTAKRLWIFSEHAWQPIHPE